MNKLLVLLIAIACITTVNAAMYNYNSAYAGIQSGAPFYGAFAPNYGYTSGGYRPYYTLHPRSCIGSGCKGSRQYSPSYGFSYDIYGNSYGGTGGYVTPTNNNIYEQHTSSYNQYSDFNTYGQAPLYPATICKAGGSCNDVGSSNWY